MKHFWALPALLRVVLASAHAFSVHDDVLAFPQYAVTFSDEHVSELQAQSRMISNDGIDIDLGPDSSASDGSSPHKQPQSEYDILVLDSQRYLCRIPQVEAPSAADANDTLSRADEEKELARANDRGWELLRGMQGNCIYYWSGWWSYRYCHGQGVKQFHQLPPTQGVPAYPPVEDPGVTGYMLGEVEDGAVDDGGQGAVAGAEKGLQRGKGAEDHDKEAAERAKTVGKLETRGDTRYLVQRLGRGTMCDLTGKPRRVEVQFHCNAAVSDRISTIKEVATCAYLMVIQTPRLCNDVAFQPLQKDSPNSITCSPILSPDQVPDYEADVSAAAAVATAALASNIPNPFEDQDQAQSAPPPTIGGIVLGAHKWIPTGSKIKKSAIVGGGKETFVETIADSMGKVLSAEQLQKMGLGDSKNVDRLKKELEKIAGGKGWKLDVFDTPRGREYRGVIGDGDDDEGGAVKEGEAEPNRGADEAAGDGGDEGSEETYKEKDEL